MQTMTETEWRALGEKLYGNVPAKWKFKCVNCGHVQTAEDFRAIDMDPNGVVHFSCIGRWKPRTGCDWTLGGLFRLHKREVISGENRIEVFLFADEPDPVEVQP